MPAVTLLCVDGCPSWQLADRGLRDLAVELDLTITQDKVETPAAAERWGFRGSPTILVNGEDVFAAGDEPVASCVRHSRDGNGQVFDEHR